MMPTQTQPAASGESERSAHAYEAPPTSAKDPGA